MSWALDSFVFCICFDLYSFNKFIYLHLWLLSRDCIQKKLSLGRKRKVHAWLNAAPSVYIFEKKKYWSHRHWTQCFWIVYFKQWWVQKPSIRLAWEDQVFCCQRWDVDKKGYGGKKWKTAVNFSHWHKHKYKYGCQLKKKKYIYKRKSMRNQTRITLLMKLTSCTQLTPSCPYFEKSPSTFYLSALSCHQTHSHILLPCTQTHFQRAPKSAN